MFSLRAPSNSTQSPDAEEEQQEDIESGQRDDLTETRRRPKKLSLPTAFPSLPIKKPGKFPREKVVGLKDAGTLSSSWKVQRKEFLQIARADGNISTDTIVYAPPIITIEEREKHAREKETTNPIALLWLGNLAALKVMVYYLITLESIITCGLTAGLIMYWYNYGLETDDAGNKRASNWSGGGMDFIILVFAVTSPLATAIGMAFTRREGALVVIADMRSFAHHLYLAHCLWDWPENGGRENCKSIDFLAHCDAVMSQLVGIGDELSRFLTLPTTSRTRHRLTKSGRREAARTIDVAYRLLESMLIQRMTRLSIYTERIKAAGLPSGEVSRLRQYERFLQNSIERLRMYKMYRTPQALRSFARIFTFLLPPFYAPRFAQVAIDLHSLAVGLSFGMITAIGLSALFESLQVMEDPFVGYLALDGIDVKEEFEVLLWSSLVKTRRMIFPEAPDYPTGRRTALSVPSATHPDDMPPRKPSSIQLATPPSAPSAVTLSSRGENVSRRDLFGSIGGSAALREDASNIMLEDSSPIAPASEVSVLTTRSNSLLDRGEGEDDDDVAEFGYPMLEDPESEAFLRQTNFRQDGEFAHHRRQRTVSSASGLLWRGNTAGGTISSHGRSQREQQTSRRNFVKQISSHPPD